VLKFSPQMVNGAQKVEEHPYNDPTGPNSRSEMLMVWGHTAAERAAQFVSGVYTLDLQQLHDLQDWCERFCQL